MIIIDFFKKLFRLKNIPMVIYLFLNVLVIAGILTLMFDIKLYQALLAALVLYTVSLLIGLSPIGELMLRIQTRCSRIGDPKDQLRLTPLFQEVYKKAQAADPRLSKKVQLFISEDGCPNAFATGTRTVCLTRGLLRLSDAQIRGTLAHEFGHLSHKDTSYCHLITVGNVFINVVFIVLQWTIRLIHMAIAFLMSLIVRSETFFTLWRGICELALRSLNVVFSLWVKLGVLLIRKSSRSNEYEADEFAYQIGYGRELCDMLESLPSEGKMGFMESLQSSHPPTPDRVARLRSLGAPGGSLLSERARY